MDHEMPVHPSCRRIQIDISFRHRVEQVVLQVAQPFQLRSKIFIVIDQLLYIIFSKGIS